MVFLSIIGLVILAVIWYVDWSEPDKEAVSLSPNDHHTVNANNERKRQQIQDLQKRIDILNKKNPDKTFYRDGAFIKERSGSQIPSTKNHDKNRGDAFLAKNEVPYLLAQLVSGIGRAELFWDDQKERMIYKPDELIQDDKDYADLTRQLLADFRSDNYDGEKILEWIDQLIITQIGHDEVTMRPQVTIEPTSSLLDNEEYLRMEVENHGRLFIRNLTNKHRWLLYPQNVTKNTIEKSSNGWSIQLSTSYLKPTTLNPFEEYRHATMKKKQIVEGIENRFWNRKQVVSFTADHHIAQLTVA